MSLMAISRKIAALERKMRAAAAAENFEAARRWRDEIATLRGEGRSSATGGGEATPEVRQPPPGQMGLGTHIPVAEPPKGWQRPKKPDPMTKNTKARGRR